MCGKHCYTEEICNPVDSLFIIYYKMLMAIVMLSFPYERIVYEILSHRVDKCDVRGVYNCTGKFMDANGI